MKILAIDTSSPVASAAVMVDSNLVGEYVISNGKTHSQIIIPLISDMLTKAGISVHEIDVFAVSLGPGSFTGLRIGIATAKSFAQALNKKIIGISALDSLHANLPCGNDLFICPIMDARRGNVYNSIYKNGIKLKDDRLININEVLEEVSGNKTIFLGDGILKHKETIVSVMGDNAIFAPANLSMQKSSSVAFLANQRVMNGEFDNIYSLEPVYVRASQAERELTGEKD